MLTALFLVVILLVCPYTCRAGVCNCCADSVVTDQHASACPHGCCANHDEPIDHDSPAPTAPDDSLPNFCICKGAIASADSPALDLEIQACWIADIESVDVATVTCSIDPLPHSRADWVNSGSALRIACCSWLC